MIHLDGVSIQSGSFALRDLTFRIESGEYAALMGKTGSGKTTILEAICGLRPVTAGKIEIKGIDVTHSRPGERGIGYVPQDGALFSTMTVREHLGFALSIRRWKRSAIDVRIAELAGWLGLTELLDRGVRGLSGGERQRIALGRGLSFTPTVVLFDEPLSALDEESRSDVRSVVEETREREGLTVLHVTHSSEDVQLLADRILDLRDGSVTERAAD